MKVCLTCKPIWGHMIRLKIGADESGWTLSLSSVSSRPNVIMFQPGWGWARKLLTCQYIVLFACFLAHGSRCSLRSLAWLEVEEAWNICFFDSIWSCEQTGRWNQLVAFVICWCCWLCLQQFPFAWLMICRLPSSRCGSAWGYHDMTWYYPMSLQSSNELHVSYIDSAKTAMHLDLRYMPCWQDGFTRHTAFIMWNQIIWLTQSSYDHVHFHVILNHSVTFHMSSPPRDRYDKLIDETSSSAVKRWVENTAAADSWLRVATRNLVCTESQVSHWYVSHMKKTLTFHQYWIDALVGFRFVWFLSVMSSDARKGQQASWQHFEYLFVTWRVVSTSLWLLDCNLHCWTMFINDWFV